MDLHKLIEDWPKDNLVRVVRMPKSREMVSAITSEVDQITERSLFVAYRGARFDLHEKIPQILQGSVQPMVLVVEDLSRLTPQFSGTVIQVTQARRAMAYLQARFWQDPSRHLFCLGVTGTNGKTSVAFMAHYLLNALSLPAGLLSTVEQRFQDKVWPAQHTTPSSAELQERLAQMRLMGASSVCMEVSSHALDQHRADFVHFNIAIFTNFTQDHLDYHKTMQHYFAAKERFFSELLSESAKFPKVAVVNGDDPELQRLKVTVQAELISFGQNPRCDFYFKVLDQDREGTVIEVFEPIQWKGRIPLVGAFNAYNAAAVVSGLTAVGFSGSRMMDLLRNFHGVPGRLQRVQTVLDKFVFVDYAHTPDALEKSLQSLREVMKGKGKLAVIFGCGGDRDSAKRPMMGRIAATLADVVILTNDNPRSEDPEKIIEQIKMGITPKASDSKVVNQKTSLPRGELPSATIEVILDRAEAIRVGIQSLSDLDVLLIAGKGHEKTQTIGDQILPFNDYEVASRFLS